ncbi:MAG: SpoIIE family protein phosphatase [Acidobacteria bacterium]|nr:SpoIIE family protein phosphatase [Acidobacteriota bacterium]
MAAFGDTMLREQLVHRRERLETAIAESRQETHLVRLLQEVDAALGRMKDGSYGLCKTCHDPIESRRLLSDPLVEYCLDHLTTDQRRSLEQDLELAAQIQVALLPKNDLRVNGWEVHYHYEAAGAVSGDYCDLMTDAAAGDLHFLLGDVSGKGVSASILMSHLHATFRSLLALHLPLNQLVERANRLFSESTMPALYATLVCGRAGRSGEVEICNAGHCLPLLVRRGEASTLDSPGLPVGLFSSAQYTVTSAKLEPGDSLFLYTDGVSEARDGSGTEYGAARLGRFVAERHDLPPKELTTACRAELAAFLSGAVKADDLTIMAIRRAR